MPRVNPQRFLPFLLGPVLQVLIPEDIAHYHAPGGIARVQQEPARAECCRLREVALAAGQVGQLGEAK
jgi:hypothetical protein